MDNIDNFRERALEVAKDLEAFSTAYNVGTLRSRAEEAASRAVHDASRKIEEAMANAELARKKAEDEAVEEGGNPTADSTVKEKLEAALERGDMLQQQVAELDKTVAGLRKEIAELLEEKRCVEEGAKQAWVEVGMLKQEVAQLKVRKHNLEEQLTAAADARLEVSTGSSKGNNSDCSTGFSFKRLLGCRCVKVLY